MAKCPRCGEAFNDPEKRGDATADRPSALFKGEGLCSLTGEAKDCPIWGRLIARHYLGTPPAAQS